MIFVDSTCKVMYLKAWESMEMILKFYEIKCYREILYSFTYLTIFWIKKAWNCLVYSYNFSDEANNYYHNFVHSFLFQIYFSEKHSWYTHFLMKKVRKVTVRSSWNRYSYKVILLFIMPNQNVFRLIEMEDKKG